MQGWILKKTDRGTRGVLIPTQARRNIKKHWYFKSSFREIKMKATFLNGVFLFLEFLFLLSILYYQYKRNNKIIIIIQALHLQI